MLIKRILHLTSSVIILGIIILSIPSPVRAASITVNPPSGKVGATVTITGEGFTGHFATIHWDDSIIVRDVQIADGGSFSYDLTVPSSARGEHAIFIDDDSNWAPSSATTNLMVLPIITVFPDTGNEWSIITITGKGFGKFENNIRIILDGNVQPGIDITADKDGIWHYQYTIPITNKGEHHISASGSITNESELGEKLLIVSPWAEVKPMSGPVGTQLIIKGWGFRTMEDGITITWDHQILMTNIQSDNDGTILLDGSKREYDIGHDSFYRESIYVPESSQGKHIVGIYGSSFTPKGILPDSDFLVTPQIKVEPPSGKKGAEIVVTGTGFAANEQVKLSFHNAVLNTAANTNSAGSFNITVTVPDNAVKDNVITAVDTSGNSSETNFTSENIEYIQAPQLVSPTNGSNVTIFDSVIDVFAGTFKYIFGIFDYWKGTRAEASQPYALTFSWKDINPNVGATYILQISSDKTFSSYALNKEITKISQYVLDKKDTITKGNYYWRVKAQYAGNKESAWSPVSEFSVNSMSVTVMILSLVIAILCLAAIIFGILMAFANISR